MTMTALSANWQLTILALPKLKFFKWAIPPSFCLFWVIFKQISLQFLQVNVKNVHPVFEHTTFRLLVSSHNHYTRGPTSKLIFYLSNSINRSCMITSNKYIVACSFVFGPSKAINKSRFCHAHAHAGTAGWHHRHSKFILCLRHLLIEMPNHSLLICLNQSDLILEVSKLHWCKTWFLCDIN